jgi:peptidoglycan/xylan/chitin deacetylase (PgdA/CDA1 family)
MHKLRIIILYIAKYLGLFWLSKIITSDGLRILCYHGFSLDDEHLFRPKLFITGNLFRQRLAKISAMGFSVISLDKAVNALKSGSGLSNSLVITVDDGWQGVEDIAWPLLKDQGFDWTLYLTTYYAEKQTQVMNVAIQYLCWKTTEKKVDFSDLGESFKEKVRVRRKSDRDALAIDLALFAETLKTAEERQDFIRNVAATLHVNQPDIEKKRQFYMLNMDSIKKMHDAGVDIQLHTHRHHLGWVNKDLLDLEIADNRQSISKVCHHSLRHFCYPSGYYKKEYPGWLSENGVVSATTCIPGLNYRKTPLLELKRFLDGENITDIEFESELSGFSSLLRKLKPSFIASRQRPQ